MTPLTSGEILTYDYKTRLPTAGVHLCRQKAIYPILAKDVHIHAKA